MKIALTEENDLFKEEKKDQVFIKFSFEQQ